MTYYPSSEIFSILCDFNTNALGTIRLNKKFLPKSVTKKQLKGGEYFAAFSNQMMCLKWKGKKDVTISTTHAAGMVLIQNWTGDHLKNPLIVLTFCILVCANLFNYKKNIVEYFKFKTDNYEYYLVNDEYECQKWFYMCIYCTNNTRKMKDFLFFFVFP